MTAAEMDIIIGAEVNGAVNGLKTVNAQLIKTEQTAAQVTKKTSTNFTGLTRVIQDLPFGFIAISNNLEQLLPAAGGLGLAFSAIVSAVTFAQIGFRNWSRGVKDNTKEVNANTQAEKENREAIQKTYEAAGQQYGQVAKLIEQSKLQVTTREQQKKILEELKGINQEFFGSLKVEGDAIAGLNAAYEAYGNNILKVARAKGAAAEVEKLTSQLLATKDAVFGLDSNFTNLNLTFDKAGKFLQGSTGGNAFEKIANASQRVTDILAKGLPTFEDIAFLVSATGLSEREVNKILSDRFDLKTKESKLTAQIASNSKLIAANEIGGIQGIKDKTQKILSDFVLIDTNIKDINAKFIDKIGVETGDHINKIVGDGSKLSKPFLQVGQSVGDATDAVLKMADSLSGFLQPAFDTVFQGIAQGESIFKSVGNAVKQLVVRLVAAVVEAAALSLIINLITGGTAGTASFGAIFSKLAGIPKFAAGGVVTKPTLAVVGENGPERITPLGYENSASNMLTGQVEFIIRGQNLYGVLNRFNSNNRNIN